MTRPHSQGDMSPDPQPGLPFLTGAVPGLAGVFKATWEDFEVTELVSREPSGDGDHTWLEVEKRGLSTAVAAWDLARALGVKPSSVGYAGMKDARAVARQWMSVEHVAPERALSLELPRIRVLRAVRHRRKLRRGWHAGNRFVIRLRPPGSVGSYPAGDPAAASRAPSVATDTPSATAGDPSVATGGDPSFPPDAVARAEGVLAELGRRGVPNYYGPQRFGYRGDTWLVGRALAREEWDEAVSRIAGRAASGGEGSAHADAADAGPTGEAAGGARAEGPDLRRARALFDAGRYAESAAAWPRGFGAPARVAAAMARTGGDAARSVAAAGKSMLRLYASAYQAWLFNRVLARRLHGIDRLRRGDLAWKHDTEALFLVDDPSAEQPRATSFEVSPTGPLVGRRMREPAGEVAELERAVLADAGFRAAELDSAALRPLTGRRRPLRFQLADVAVAAGRDAAGPFLELRFALPPGCYATSVLRELGKGGIVAGGTPVALVSGDEPESEGNRDEHDP